MQGHAAGNEKTLFEVEGYLLEDHDRDGQRQVKHRGQGRKQPHQFRPAVDPLNEKIPGGVTQGGCENECQTERRHQ